MSDVKESHSWVNMFLNLSIKKRLEWVKLIFQGMLDKFSRDRGLKTLVLSMKDRKQFDLIGFSVNIEYIKHGLRPGDEEDDLNHIFVHAWGSPKLLLKHKKYPILIVCGDDLKLDESILDEHKQNEKENIRGITG